jgi:hypothetical protein
MRLIRPLPVLYLCCILLTITSCHNENRQAEREEHGIDLTAAGDTVELFGENLISDKLNERDMAISVDGNEMYYSVTTPDHAVMAIVGLKKTGSSWTDPELVPFSGVYKDIEPFLSPDGKRLFFSSNRPLDENDSIDDFDIWFVERSGGEWKNPRNVGSPVNSLKDEFYPAVTASGNLYFTASIEGTKGAEDIFLSRYNDGVYQAPVSLDTTVNSQRYEFNAYVSPNEDLIIFSSFGRPDGFGGGDLYFSRKDPAGKWSAAKNMGKLINSDKLDYCPFADTERGVFYFTSTRSGEIPESQKDLSDIYRMADRILNGQGNIYRIKLSALPL